MASESSVRDGSFWQNYLLRKWETFPALLTSVRWTENRAVPCTQWEWSLLGERWVLASEREKRSRQFGRFLEVLFYDLPYLALIIIGNLFLWKENRAWERQLQEEKVYITVHNIRGQKARDRVVFTFIKKKKYHIGLISEYIKIAYTLIKPFPAEILVF